MRLNTRNSIALDNTNQPFRAQAPLVDQNSGRVGATPATSFPLMVKGKAWLGIKDPPAGEGQVGRIDSMPFALF